MSEPRPPDAPDEPASRAGGAQSTPAEPAAAKPDAAAVLRRWRRRVLILFVVAAVAALAWVFWPQPELDLAAWLAERGLELNTGFAGHYLPGTVVRTHRPDADGTPRQLARPEIELWPDQCFPGKTPKEASFPLPKGGGKRSAALSLGGEKAKRLLPSLGTQGARSWEIEFTKPRILTFARGDLARQFSDPCLDRLEQLFDAGSDPASMATILEAVVADGLRITVDWQAGVDGEGAARRSAEQLKSEEVTVKAELDAENKTVLEAEGQVVVAYRVAVLVPVSDE